MYKLFTLLLVILFTSLTLNAQNSKEEYDKAVDYCACKIAYAYTNQYISNGKAESYDQNEFDREKKSFENTIKQQLESCNIEEHIAFNNLKTLLTNNNFGGFVTKLEGAVEESKKVNVDSIDKQQAIKNILDGFYNNENFNKIVLKYPAVKELKSSLETDVNNILKSFEVQALSVSDNEPITTSESNSTNEINHSNSIINREGTAQTENSFIPNWLIYVLILLTFIILFSYNYLNNKKLNERIDRRLSKSEYQQSKIKIDTRNNRSEKNSSFEKDINQKIEDVNLAIRKLQTENTSNKPSIITQKKNQNIQSKPKVEIRKIYAKAPNEKGVFKSSDVNENKDGKFYIFTLINNSEAQFEFFNTQNNAIQAVDSPEIFLFPVNDSVTALNQNAKRIITNKPGIAIKQDEKWIVKEKAQITYE